MGVVEGCPSYWRRDGNCHGYCGQHIWVLCCYALLVTMKRQKRNEGLHLKTLLFLDLYRIQIVQNIAQLSSKGRFNQPPLFLLKFRLISKIKKHNLLKLFQYIQMK
jgi:hypothetical protein